MIKLEDHVTSLGLSRKLKELGVKQESLFYLVCVDSLAEPEWIILTEEKVRSKEEDEINWLSEYTELVISAFTSSEIGLMLPDECGTVRDYDLGFTVYGYESLEDGSAKMNHYHECDTEANARAKLLIYLIENNILKL